MIDDLGFYVFVWLAFGGWLIAGALALDSVPTEHRSGAQWKILGLVAFAIIVWPWFLISGIASASRRSKPSAH